MTLSSALQEAELSEASTSTTISTDSNQHAASSYAAILGRPSMDNGKRNNMNNNHLDDDDDDFYSNSLLNAMVTSSSSPTCQLDSSSASFGIGIVPQSGLGVDHELAVKKEDLDGILGMELQDNSIAGWLSRLGLSQYIDVFQHQGFENLFQLTDFSQENLERMNIPAHHRGKIWKSLLEFHQANQLSDVAQALGRSSGMTSADTFLSSQMTQSQPSQPSQQSVYNPGFYEVTRYTFKHTISMTKESVSAKPQQSVPESESPSKKVKSSE